jgi:hypothetical protein
MRRVAVAVEAADMESERRGEGECARVWTAERGAKRGEVVGWWLVGA